MKQNKEKVGIVFSSIVEDNGKPIKENNMSKNHNVPIDTLVELKDYYDCSGDDGAFIKGIARFFVVEHNRDCDGTPLYTLCLHTRKSIENLVKAYNDDGMEINLNDFNHVQRRYFHLISGYSEDSLKVISFTEENKNEK
jgi:hypothetical protein